MEHRIIDQDADGEITPTELSARLAGGDAIQLLDVREPHEYAYAHIDGAQLIPLRTLPSRTAELDRSRDLIVYCHHGMRSAHAVEFLRRDGFDRVRNLAGGIDRWSTDVDPAVPRY
jgi:rhodanese-related sulfurtransferase